MSKMLVSISNSDELQTVLSSGVDIIDFKNPQAGALGALPLDEVRAMVEVVGTTAMTSATIGDLPMYPELLYEASLAMAATGVGIVKIGFFSEENIANCIRALKPLVTAGVKLVAVLIADSKPNVSVLKELSAAGFYGAMLDTADKTGKNLLDFYSTAQLRAFVSDCRELRMMSGLAGALRKHHIQSLSSLGADYLGFRGALCAEHDRVGRLEESRLKGLISMLRKSNIKTDEYIAA